jgi:hypothetical protein
LLGGAALLALATSAQARVTAIHIETRTPAPTKPGERPYEIITGTFDGDLSPSRDAIITDIGQAPAGKTAASAIARRLPSPAPGAQFRGIVLRRAQPGQRQSGAR